MNIHLFNMPGCEYIVYGVYTCTSVFHDDL